MQKQLSEAAGYLSIFFVPLLLVAGIWIDTPSLAFAVVMLVFPLLRPVFGNVTRQPLVWHELLATALDRLPLAYAVALTAVTALVLHHLALHGTPSIAYAIGLGLSLWM